MVFFGGGGAGCWRGPYRGSLGLVLGGRGEGGRIYKEYERPSALRRARAYSPDIIPTTSSRPL